jgi:hypothetical protein
VPRRTGIEILRKSSLLSQRFSTFLTITLRVTSVSRLRRISAMPKSPTASETNCRPWKSSGTPKVNRGVPVPMSWPTVPSSSPSTIIASALRVDPLASVIEAIRPSTISEKNSAGPKLNAAREMGAATRATTTVATVPAKKDPRAAVASALPARPRLAISCPSMAVTAADDSPGRLMRMAVVDPPYWAP